MAGRKPRCGNGARPYHHGNLRDELIIAAAQLIEERASTDFAMIDAARKAGVSSAAPYRHFRDREALLEAVCQLGFLGLNEAVRDSARHTRPGTAEHIITHGRTYVRYVTEKQAFYDLMWGDMSLRALDLEDETMKTSGFYLVVDAVQQYCQQQRGLDDYDALELSVKLWAMAHGLACLAMNHQLERFIPDADVDRLLVSSTLTFLDGLPRRPFI